RSLEQPQISALKARDPRRPYLRQHCRHFPRRQIANGLYVAPILIPERRIPEQILDRLQPLRFKHRGTSRSDALQIHKWCGKVQWSPGGRQDFSVRSHVASKRVSTAARRGWLRACNYIAAALLFKNAAALSLKPRQRVTNGTANTGRRTGHT